MQAAQPSPTVSPWISAARGAIVDIAATALSSVCACHATTALPEGFAGALVPIVSDRGSVQVGLFSSEDGCAVLARALLGFSPADKLSRVDVIDAVNEIVNMLAGNAKARMPHFASHAALGLPTFVHGPIETSARQVIQALSIQLAGIDACVVIVEASA